MQTNREMPIPKQRVKSEVYIPFEDFPAIKKMKLEDRGQVELMGFVASERKEDLNDSDYDIVKVFKLSDINIISKKARME